jgi:hypothetical protein
VYVSEQLLIKFKRQYTTGRKVVFRVEVVVMKVLAMVFGVVVVDEEGVFEVDVVVAVVKVVIAGVEVVFEEGVMEVEIGVVVVEVDDIEVLIIVVVEALVIGDEGVVISVVVG